jgi:phosphoadenosine phosphosulfate reductase
VLIPSPRHTAADLAHWRRLEAGDALRWRRDERRLMRAVEVSMDTAARFIAAGSCYAGLSTGKDSVLLCHILRRLREARGIAAPVAYVEVIPHASPEAPAVLDAIAGWGLDVVRIEVRDVAASVGTGRLEAGFAECARRWGDRYLSGVRAEESRARAMRDRYHGAITARTCAPLSRWSTADVYAAAYGLGLPLHPAYAMTMGGLLPREYLRVATIGGTRGTERGRREWEWRYYRDVLDAQGLHRDA